LGYAYEVPSVGQESCSYGFGWRQGPRPDARIVYMDGAFDLFHAGHVEVQCCVTFFIHWFSAWWDISESRNIYFQSWWKNCAHWQI
jgi:hypothetical protein